ncbi:MAG: hypothetical protein ACM3QY_11035, partial [Candidatus Levyibacteriota bacterium]
MNTTGAINSQSLRMEHASMPHIFDSIGRILVRGWRGAGVALFALCLAGPAWAATAQRSFPSADDAASALVQAAKAHDRPAILAILGAGA